MGISRSRVLQKLGFTVDFNPRSLQLHSSPEMDSAGPVILGTSLASQDTNRLARISATGDSTPLLAGIAGMKSVAYRTNAGLGAITRTTPPDRSKLILKSQEDEQPVMATYDGRDFLVERKYSTTPRSDFNTRRILDARVDNIVLRLQHPRKPAELRTLPCVGMIADELPADDTTKSTYSLIYRVEAPWVFSLRKLLSKKDQSKVPQFESILPLGQRFRIAQTLARAIMYLHMADWLHKAVRSKNILFFGTDLTSLRNKLPYLVGFEYSRPDGPDESTEDVITDVEGRLYRHPKSGDVPRADLQQPLGGPGRYKKAYDIYSMGVVFVELGLFKSITTILKEYSGCNVDVPAHEIRHILLEKAIPRLRFAMGDMYADVARICVNGFFDQFDATSLHTEFYTHVVQNLELCSV